MIEKKIKILQIGFSSNPGGVENLVYSYFKHIDKNKFEFDFLDMYGDGIAYANEIEKLGGRIFSIENYKRHPLKACIKLKDLLNKERYDIVHVHMQSAANLMPIIIPYLHREEVVIAHSHSSSTPKGMLRKLLNSLNVKLLRKLKVEKWACGATAGIWMWGDKFDKENIIPNAIEAGLFEYDEKVRNKIRKQCGILSNERVIGFVGRFGDEKNTFFLIDVLKELLRKQDNYKLLTVGGNGLYDEFVKKIKQEHLEDKYYSAGIQLSTKEWYQAMDAFLLPSFFEGFPVVGVEAQAAGLKCFFSNNISKEIDISGTNYFLPIEKASIDAQIWAEEINNIISSENRKILLNQKYDIKYAINILQKKYYHILENRGLYHVEKH